jgi:hypothetical protein
MELSLSTVTVSVFVNDDLLWRTADLPSANCHNMARLPWADNKETYLAISGVRRLVSVTHFGISRVAQSVQ